MSNVVKLKTCAILRRRNAGTRDISGRACALAGATNWHAGDISQGDAGIPGHVATSRRRRHELATGDLDVEAPRVCVELMMYDSVLDVETHRLSDGGLLISVNGSSYATYMKEEVNTYR